MTDQPVAPSKPPVWRDPRMRALFFQLLALLVVVLFFGFILNNTLSNMETRGITTGFGFLDREAGFGILMSLIDYDETYSYGRTFFVGLLNTLLVASLGVVFATLLGLLVALMQLSNNWLVRTLGRVYIEVFRNIPVLLQIFFWYIAVIATLPGPRQSIGLFSETVFANNRGLYVPTPIPGESFDIVIGVFLAAIVGVIYMTRWARRRQAATGKPFPMLIASIGLLLGAPFLTFLALGSPMSFEYAALQGLNFGGGVKLIPELVALLIALAINHASDIAEDIRAGILSVPKGQTEASSALGLKKNVAMNKVILPQALRLTVPPTATQFMNLTKNSSLATAIGYPDLVQVFMGTTLNQTGQAVEIVAMTMAVYLTINLIISGLMNLYNSSIVLKER